MVTNVAWDPQGKTAKTATRMIIGCQNEILSYLVEKVFAWALQKFWADDIKILRGRSLEVVVVYGMMSRSQEEVTFLACVFSSVSWVHTLWTSL